MSKAIYTEAIRNSLYLSSIEKERAIEVINVIPEPTETEDEKDKEIKRLKGVIKILFDSPALRTAFKAFDIDPEKAWEDFKAENNI